MNPLCRGMLPALIATGALATAGAAARAPEEFSEPAPLLAQRAIERDWGPSDDSLYVETEVRDWREESVAFGLSAVVPGSGQWYAGSPRWWWFATAEVVGWTVFGLHRARADEFRDNAAGYAGDPADPASNWSLERYAAATGADPEEMERLYAGDREAFYERIGSDPVALDGWVGDAPETRRYFTDQRELSDERLEMTHWASSLLWINHVLSAWDALRAARQHNAGLPAGATLRINTGWKHGDPTWKLAIERRF